MAGIHPRARVAEAICEKIIVKRLPAGRSVGEVALARELGVSRTPVREALLALEGSGLVRARRGQGFVVEPLDRREAEEAYPIVATLERLAVETCQVSEDLLDRLRAANRRLAAAERPFERVAMDAAWHRILVSGSGNERLAAMIESVKQTILRYEYDYLQSSALRDHSIAEHEHITALLERSPAAAGKEIERHWLAGMQQVLETLSEGGE